MLLASRSLLENSPPLILDLTYQLSLALPMKKKFKVTAKLYLQVRREGEGKNLLRVISVLIAIAILALMFLQSSYLHINNLFFSRQRNGCSCRINFYELGIFARSYGNNFFSPCENN